MTRVRHHTHYMALGVPSAPCTCGNAPEDGCECGSWNDDVEIIVSCTVYPATRGSWEEAPEPASVEVNFVTDSNGRQWDEDELDVLVQWSRRFHGIDDDRHWLDGEYDAIVRGCDAC